MVYMIAEQHKCQDVRKSPLSRHKSVMMPVDSDNKIPLIKVYTLLLININGMQNQRNIFFFIITNLIPFVFAVILFQLPHNAISFRFLYFLSMRWWSHCLI